MAPFRDAPSAGARGRVTGGERMKNDDCLFCRIVRGEIPGAKVYEDDHVFAFLDIGPLTKGHVLVVPKKHCDSLFSFDAREAEPLVRALQKVGAAAMRATGATGLNVIQNNGPAAGQTVFHMHWHLVPRHEGDNALPWNAGAYSDPAAMNALAAKIADALSSQPESS